VEIDGGIHNDPDICANDLRRQQHLEEAGFIVLRFSNEEVLRSIREVRMKLEDWIEEREKGSEV
jgi:very-short-patch-repair endonuclease